MSRRTASVALTAVLGAALLTGCGTGLHAKTYTENGREDGVQADVGGSSGIAVRALHVAPPQSGSSTPAGSTLFVTGGLSNNGTSDDALVGASSDVAGAATLLVDGTPTTQVAIPAGGTAPLSWSLALTNTTRAVSVATYVPVTLEFQRAGRITLQVPVRIGTEDLSGRSPAQDPYHVE